MILPVTIYILRIFHSANPGFTIQFAEVLTANVIMVTFFHQKSALSSFAYLISLKYTQKNCPPLILRLPDIQTQTNQPDSKLNILCNVLQNQAEYQEETP